MPQKRLWGGRFNATEDQLFKDFNDSLSFDRELLQADIQGSLAYAAALERAGVLKHKERIALQRGLNRLLEEHLRHPDAIARSRVEDVHTYVEERLQRLIGPTALKLHTGRSRNDQVSTDLRLYLRSKESEIEGELNRLLTDIGSLAEKHQQSIMPGYTHLQRAQPVSFAHFLLAYGDMLLRDRSRLREARVRMNICPLGSGALSGTVYEVDREALARELGFTAPSRNSMDAVSDRDFVMDFLYFGSVLMVHLSRLAEDLILYSTAEFGFVQLDDSVASGSSLMPQKKNPDALELIRGKSGRMFGHLISLLAVLKGLPMTYNKDLQEDKEGLFDAIRTIMHSLQMTRRVLGRLKVFPKRMEEACARGYLDATELTDYLVAKNMPFRDAHHLVGRIVVRAMELDLPLERLSLREYQSFSPMFDGDLFDYLKLGKILNKRKSSGGTSPAAVHRALKSFRKLIAQ